VALTSSSDLFAGQGTQALSRVIPIQSGSCDVERQVRPQMTVGLWLDPIWADKDDAATQGCALVSPSLG
jgi:hypothetical protein